MWEVWPEYGFMLFAGVRESRGSPHPSERACANSGGGSELGLELRRRPAGSSLKGSGLRVYGL